MRNYADPVAHGCCSECQKSAIRKPDIFQALSILVWHKIKTATIFFYLHPFPISTLMLKWPPHITTINTRKPHLGEKRKKQAQIKTVTTVVIKITIQNILCITEIQICPGWIPRCNNIGLYTIHIKHTQDPSSIRDSPSYLLNCFHCSRLSLIMCYYLLYYY